MKISVVTAVYNRRHSIEMAVQSVQGQSFTNYEHVIQDGGSTDGTLEIIESVPDSRTRLESGPDKGIYDAINRGIARSTGDVVGLMHSDDIFAHKDVLASVADAFDDPKVDGVYGDLHYVSNTDPRKIVRNWVSGDYHPSKLRTGWMPPHPTLYLRREVFENWGLYDTDFQIAADYDAMLRYLVKGQINLSYIPDVLVKMRLGGESNKSLGRILQKSREDYRAIKRNGVGGVGTLIRKNTQKIGQLF